MAVFYHNYGMNVEYFIMKKALILAIFAVFMAFALPVGAQEESAVPEIKPAFRATDFPLPRFVSLRSDKIFARAGPGPQFPIKWEYKQKGLPVEIILEYDNWRKIRDIEGDESWVHKSLLSGVRTVLVKSEQPVPVLRKPGADERLVATIEPSATATVESCEEGWCHLASGGVEGWVERQYLWGVYERELF
jgi:SH3-like domain-containing protein